MALANKAPFTLDDALSALALRYLRHGPTDDLVQSILHLRIAKRLPPAEDPRAVEGAFLAHEVRAARDEHADPKDLGERVCARLLEAWVKTGRSLMCTELPQRSKLASIRDRKYQAKQIRELLKPRYDDTPDDRQLVEQLWWDSSDADIFLFSACCVIAGERHLVGEAHNRGWVAHIGRLCGVSPKQVENWEKRIPADLAATWVYQKHAARALIWVAALPTLGAGASVADFQSTKSFFLEQELAANQREMLVCRRRVKRAHLSEVLAQYCKERMAEEEGWFQTLAQRRRSQAPAELLSEKAANRLIDAVARGRSTRWAASANIFDQIRGRRPARDGRVARALAAMREKYDPQ